MKTAPRKAILNPIDKMIEFTHLFNSTIDKEKKLGLNVNMFTVAVNDGENNIILTNAEQLASIFTNREMHLYCPKYKKFDHDNKSSLLLSLEEITVSNKKEAEAIHARQNFDQTIRPRTTFFAMYNQYSKILKRNIQASFTIGLSKSDIDKNEFFYKNIMNIHEVFNSSLNIALNIDKLKRKNVLNTLDII
ncbi:hypothetical protein [Fluviispira vulneris]|uniref:hypothetical protein n=1 Tax=Fluviispira vulneris TaxID=2763012 RepID=UPI0016451472|nr:hypothetical protein [Fluviispira vulneris]